MLPKNLKIIFFSLIFLAFILSPNLVLAQNLEIQYPPIPFGATETPNQFMQKIETGVYPPEYALPLYIRYFYYLSLMIAGLVALGAIIIGGLQYLISFGAPVKMIIAREQIMGGFLSLILLFSSYLILALINPELLVFKVSIEQREFDPVDVEKTVFAPRTYFQIPTGIIIENAVLGLEAEIKMENVKKAAEETRKASQELKNLAEELKKETDKCRCGTTQCAGPSGCGGISCPQAKCDTDKIEELSEQVRKAIKILEEKRDETKITSLPLIDDLSQLAAAAFLMSLEYEEIFTYNDLLSMRQYPDPLGREIEIDSFPGWENINLKVNGRIVKDPLTFYLDKEKNEDAIYLASVYRWGTYAGIPPEPLGGWPDAPHIEPGKLVWPTRTEKIKITSYYGYRIDPITGAKGVFHPGIDIGGPKLFGTPAYSIADGTVVATYKGESGGNTVIVRHPEFGISSAYLHLLDGSFNVFPGQEISAGHVVGLIDTTGDRQTGPHLHFEYRIGLAGITDGYWRLRSVDPCKGERTLEGCMKNF